MAFVASLQYILQNEKDLVAEDIVSLLSDLFIVPIILYSGGKYRVVENTKYLGFKYHELLEKYPCNALTIKEALLNWIKESI